MTNLVNHTPSEYVVLIGCLLLFLSACTSIIFERRVRIAAPPTTLLFTYYTWIVGNIFLSVGIFYIVNKYLH